MTPQEKAEQLIDSFKKYAHSNPLHDSELFYRKLHENAKQCALIAVDLMIDAYSFTPVGSMEWAEKKEQYWQEVKQRLEKL